MKRGARPVCGRQHHDRHNSKTTYRGVYGNLKIGNVAAAFELLSDDIIWNEAEGNPLADRNPYKSAAEIGEGVFGRLAAIYDDFASVPDEFVAEGDRVVVFCRYLGTHKKTGTPLNCQAVHSWTVDGDKIVRFQQYADTEQLTRLG
jgi:ketosteroid isomerase-like protein